MLIKIKIPPPRNNDEPWRADLGGRWRFNPSERRRHKNGPLDAGNNIGAVASNGVKADRDDGFVSNSQNRIRWRVGKGG
jgi:hypothetical protein